MQKMSGCAAFEMLLHDDQCVLDTDHDIDSGNDLFEAHDDWKRVLRLCFCVLGWAMFTKLSKIYLGGPCMRRYDPPEDSVGSSQVLHTRQVMPTPVTSMITFCPAHGFIQVPGVSIPVYNGKTLSTELCGTNVCNSSTESGHDSMQTCHAPSPPRTRQALLIGRVACLI